jgi:hypothetical protein
MKRGTKLVARTFVSITGATTVALLLQGCPEQPEIQCSFARGPFSARYTLVERSGTCDGVPEIVGEIIGVEQYFVEKSGKKADLSKPSVALQADTMGTLAQERNGNTNPDLKLYALGALNSPDPAGNFCSVGSLNPAQLELAEVLPDAGSDPDGGVPGDAGDPDASDDASVGEDDAGSDAAAQEPSGKPAVSMRYDWSNVRFLVKPEIPGQAFDADLTITLNGCATKYRVNAISYPGYWSSPLCAPTDPDSGAIGEADDARCATYANPDLGLAAGSQINPRFKTRCEPATKYCVLVDEVSNYQ